MTRRRPLLSAKLRSQRAAGHILRRLARPAGFDVVRHDYHSVVARIDEVPEEVWMRRSALHGIRFDPAAQLAWARQELAPYIAEFSPDGIPGWHPRNDYFENVDAEILYAQIRRWRPSRIVELGSGYSSMVIAEACRRNAAHGSPARYVAYDPFPRHDLVAGLPVEAVAAQDVPLEAFLELAEGDVLFVDTSHTVKPGGDVNRIVLDVLPLLAPGVMVHFHDVLLPGEYHRHWVASGLHWAEAYLVQAFLAFNDHYVVRFGCSAVWLDHRAELQALVPNTGPEQPSSLWLERVDPGA